VEAKKITMEEASASMDKETRTAACSGVTPAAAPPEYDRFRRNVEATWRPGHLQRGDLIGSWRPGPPGLHADEARLILAATGGGPSLRTGRQA
jgi:hypothetical protein